MSALDSLDLSKIHLDVVEIFLCCWEVSLHADCYKDRERLFRLSNNYSTVCFWCCLEDPSTPSVCIPPHSLCTSSETPIGFKVVDDVDDFQIGDAVFQLKLDAM